MSIPRKTRRTDTFEITMMELRKQPGEVIDAVRDGASVRVTRSRRHVATISPVDVQTDSMITVRPDGTTEDGRVPLTKGQPALIPGSY